MNKKALENIISFYKQNYTKIEKQEIYKWKAFTTFHNNWDIEAVDFKGMLKKSLKDTSNLMSASNYYPRRMILWMAEKDEETVRKMFRNLYDTSLALEQRIQYFKVNATSLIHKYKEKKENNTYQDDRAIMVYLSLRYPEKYYLYKYTMFKDFVNYIEYDEPPKSGHIENLFKFESMCNYVHNYIMHDDELLKMYEPRRKQYYDPDYHLLVQDIIYTKIKSLKVAFVVDECHRAVTPQTKRDIERFFSNSLWFGFTGTPIFEENKYEQKGDLPQTTEELYGPCLHSYTIKEAIHDGAVLGFNVENLGPKNISKDDEDKYYHSENHMRNVLNVILNQLLSKFGMQNGRGKTYEAMLTVESIPVAQKYYDMLLKIKSGEDTLKISDDVKKVLPDFPKVAITFSVSENDDASKKNQDAMKRYLTYYNKLFETRYAIDGIGAYNGNLNDRLARKEKRYTDRDQQIDLVIVVDRLLTGFDAPCLSTLFIDRPPMSPQGLIQAFSRTNRLFDQNKEYGQIVTFRSPKEYKDKINEALILYSKGGIGEAIAEDWNMVLENFCLSLKTIRSFAPEPGDVMNLSKKQKKTFIKLFRDLDHDYAHLKSFSTFEPRMLEQYHFSQEIYEDYAAVYKNVMEELKKDPIDDPDDPLRDDYDLVAYSKFKIDFEYIVELLQGFVDFLDQQKDDFDETEFEHKLLQLRGIVKEFAEDNPRLSDLLLQVLDEIEQDKAKFMGQDISVTINQMRYAAIDKEIEKFAAKWYIPFEDVKYEAYNFKDGELANENKLKELADYSAYKAATENALPKFKFNGAMISEFKDVMMPEISPLF